MYHIGLLISICHHGVGHLKMLKLLKLGVIVGLKVGKVFSFYSRRFEIEDSKSHS